MMEEHNLDEVYGLVEDLTEQFDALSAVREQAGGNGEIIQRVREHEELMLAVPRLEESVDVLTDYVVGEKMPDPLHPGEFLINGRGQPMRDQTTGLKAQVATMLVLLRSLSPNP